MDNNEFAVPPNVRVTFVGFRDTEGPFGIMGEIVAVRFTTPENPLTLERVRLDDAEKPGERVIEVEFTVIVKSRGGGDVTSMNAWTECHSFPLDPVRFSVNAPTGVVFGTSTVNMALPVPVSRETEFGFDETVMLVAEGGVAFRLTLPAKP